jgi:uncharacterized protein YbcI
LGTVSASENPDDGVLADVTRGLVQLHREYYGKGPTKARSYMVNDTLLSIFDGGFTTVEQTLISDGRAQVVEDMRRGFQAAMESRFREVVEGSTGRKVLAYMSQIHTDPDLAVELFVLEPAAANVTAEHEVELAEEDPSRGKHSN